MVVKNQKRSKSRSKMNESSSSDLLKEAEDFIKGKMSNLLGLGYQCGIATKERCQQEMQKAFDEDDVDIDEPVKISWRMDPRQNGSDWVLLVKDGQRSQIYHIHRTTLIYGERKSGYFNKIFEKIYEDGNPNRRNVTEVPLDPYCAMFFPLMLDYIYADKLELTATIAPGLRHIANTLDVRQLYALVSSFIQQDLSEKTVATYLEQTELSNDKELSDIALQLAIQSFEYIADEELGKIPVSNFQQIVSNPNVKVSSPETLSLKIAKYFRARLQDIDDESFFFLTHVNIIPKIHPDEALYYLDIGAKNFISTLEDETAGGYEASLLRRCVIAAGEEWKAYIGPIQRDIAAKQKGSSGTEAGEQRLFGNGAILDEAGKAYLGLPDRIKVELLQESLVKASLDRGRGRGFRSHSHDPIARSREDGIRLIKPMSSGDDTQERKKNKIPKPPTRPNSREFRSDTPTQREGRGQRNGGRRFAIRKNSYDDGTV